MVTNPGASFVTLRHGTALRGFVGSLSAHRALHWDVAEDARAAALRDQRFEPLLPTEFAETQVEVAVLTAAMPMSFANERNLHGQLRPGVDGLTVAYEDVTVS
jgi:AMMECR1 domain-containing protein